MSDEMTPDEKEQYDKVKKKADKYKRFLKFIRNLMKKSDKKQAQQQTAFQKVFSVYKKRSQTHMQLMKTAVERKSSSDGMSTQTSSQTTMITQEDEMSTQTSSHAAMIIQEDEMSTQTSSQATQITQEASNANWTNPDEPSTSSKYQNLSSEIAQVTQQTSTESLETADEGPSYDHNVIIGGAKKKYPYRVFAKMEPPPETQKRKRTPSNEEMLNLPDPASLEGTGEDFDLIFLGVDEEEPVEPEECTFFPPMLAQAQKKVAQTSTSKNVSGPTDSSGLGKTSSTMQYEQLVADPLILYSAALAFEEPSAFNVLSAQLQHKEKKKSNILKMLTFLKKQRPSDTHPIHELPSIPPLEKYSEKE